MKTSAEGLLTNDAGGFTTQEDAIYNKLNDPIQMSHPLLAKSVCPPWEAWALRSARGRQHHAPVEAKANKVSDMPKTKKGEEAP